jgi:hypothetical protein
MGSRLLIAIHTRRLCVNKTRVRFASFLGHLMSPGEVARPPPTSSSPRDKLPSSPPSDSWLSYCIQPSVRAAWGPSSSVAVAPASLRVETVREPNASARWSGATVAGRLCSLHCNSRLRDPKGYILHISASRYSSALETTRGVASLAICGSCSALVHTVVPSFFLFLFNIF